MRALDVLKTREFSMVALPAFITFTGLDVKTDLKAANAISAKYPLEWGILFSRTQKDNRYVDKKLLKRLALLDAPLCAHLCGSYAREAMEGKIPGDIDLSIFRRVQVNGSLSTDNKLSIFQDSIGKPVIVQQKERFDDQSEFLQLFDVSGGRGILPSKIPCNPGGGKLMGFAGGMGPQTVKSYLSNMNCGNHEFWIDMEGRIRTNDLFDLHSVQQVCEIVYKEPV